MAVLYRGNGTWHCMYYYVYTLKYHRVCLTSARHDCARVCYMACRLRMYVTYTIMYLFPVIMGARSVALCLRVRVSHLERKVLTILTRNRWTCIRNWAAKRYSLLRSVLPASSYLTRQPLSAPYSLPRTQCAYSRSHGTRQYWQYLSLGTY